MTFPFEIVTFQLTFVHFSRGEYCNYINQKHIKQQKRNSLTTCIVKSLGFGKKNIGCVFFGSKFDTLPETSMAPENGWLEYSFPFGIAYFQGRTVSFRECKSSKSPWHAVTTRHNAFAN